MIIRWFLKNIFNIIFIFLIFLNISYANTNPYENNVSTSIKNNVDSFVQNIEQKKSNMSEDKYNSMIENLLVQLNRIEKKYENNSKLKNLIWYLYFEISELKVSSTSDESLEDFLCKLSWSCKEEENNNTNETNIENNNINSSNEYCDKKDIVLDNWQIWSACNVWTNKAWLNSDSYGKYFQWWRSKWFSNDSSYNISEEKIDNYNPKNDNYSFIKTTSEYNESWSKTPINKWDSEWICPTWYRIPSMKDWSDAFTSITWKNWNSYKEDAVKDIEIFTEKLLLPSAWKIWINGSKNWQSQQWIYLSSSSKNDFQMKILSWNKYINSPEKAYIYPDAYWGKWVWWSVRCIKNEISKVNKWDNNSSWTESEINNSNYGSCDKSKTKYYKTWNACVWANFNCDWWKLYWWPQFSPAPPKPNSNINLYDTLQECKDSEDNNQDEISINNNQCITSDKKTIESWTSVNLYTPDSNSCSITKLYCNNWRFDFSEPQFSPAPPVPQEIYTSKTICENKIDNDLNENNNKTWTWSIKYSWWVSFSPTPPNCWKQYKEWDSCSNIWSSCIYWDYLYSCERKETDIKIDHYWSSLNNCSSASASLTNQIFTSSDAIQICQEYKIDNPNRKNDNFTCSDSDFKSITSLNWWNKSRWYWQKYTRLQDNQSLVPGSYRIVIKNQEWEKIYWSWYTIDSRWEFSNPNNCFYTRYKAKTVEQAVYYLINTPWVHYNSWIDWSELEKIYWEETTNKIRLDIIRMAMWSRAPSDIVSMYSKTMTIPKWTWPTYYEGSWWPYNWEKWNPAIYSFSRDYEWKNPWIVWSCVIKQNYSWVKWWVVNCSNRTYSWKQEKEIKANQSKNTLSVTKSWDFIKYTIYGLDYENAKSCQNVIAHPYVPSAINTNYCDDSSKYKYMKNLKWWNYNSSNWTWENYLRHDPKLFAPWIKIQWNWMDWKTWSSIKWNVITIIE